MDQEDIEFSDYDEPDVTSISFEDEMNRFYRDIHDIHQSRNLNDIINNMTIEINNLKKNNKNKILQLEINKTESNYKYIGLQKQLLTKLVIDIWLIGGHYGNSNGILKFVAPEKLPSQAVTALQQTLDDTKVNPFELKSKVDQNGATADMKGPWAGFRGLGISLGLRF